MTAADGAAKPNAPARRTGCDGGQQERWCETLVAAATVFVPETSTGPQHVLLTPINQDSKTVRPCAAQVDRAVRIGSFV